MTIHDSGSCAQCDGIPVRITDYVGEDSSPDWNPDTSGGDEIVYHRKNHGGSPGPSGKWPCANPPGGVNCWDVYKVAVSGGTTANSPTQLTDTATAYDGTGTWSPDGSEIVFRRTNSAGNEIYTMPSSGDMSGTAAARVTYVWYHDQTPDWSPDGTRFAWGSSRLIDGDPTCGGANECDPEFDIWVSYADGSGQERITSGTDNDREPDWQPLPCTITGTSGNDTGTGELVGTAGDDVVCGLAGDDTLKGMGGNDVLIGGSGNDAYNGGDGNDWFDEESGPNGADAFYGGNGTDTLSYVNRTNRVRITLNGTADDGDPDANSGAGEGDATYGAGENQLGGSGNDVLGGSSNAERFYGFDGDDVLQG